MGQANVNRLSAAGLLVTLGIIFGDIGTSPLYVMSSIVGKSPIQESLVYGAVSAIFWTLTIQTSLKYVWLVLQADNKGEGGIFSLYALVQRRAKWLFWPAMIGAAAMLCDGMITPPISVTSAVEGLLVFNPDIPIVPIVVIIITILFIFQRYGTKLLGRAFGPVMLVWFSLLGILGISQIAQHPEVFRALNPMYAYNLLVEYPGGIFLLGAVFLCTTGAEALYSDLGHTGRANIRISWIFVKGMLLLNYLGQAAWLMNQTSLDGRNPFYSIMPEWLLMPGIVIATIATIIASQAMISGSFTLVSEAVHLNFWPKVAIKYPTNLKGQLYIPSVNWLLYAGCIFIALHFKESTRMVAIYGFFITVTMMMTTVLMLFFMKFKLRWPIYIVMLMVAVFLTVEASFFSANLMKMWIAIKESWVMIVIFLILIHVMWITYMYRRMSNYFLQFDDLDTHLHELRALSADKNVPKFATHLVFLTKANFKHQVERKIMESILAKTPKRADIYWFVHVDRTNEPYTQEYQVEEIEQDLVIKVNIRLGFRVQPKVHYFFRYIVDEMVARGELDLISKPEPYAKYNNEHDFKFVVLEKFLSADNDLSVRDSFITNGYIALKRISLSDINAWGLEESDTVLEKVPLIVRPARKITLTRREADSH
jgi:KUP system potassium uptake protein